MKLERSDFSSLLAVLISLGALGVSLYEANLMQKQQLILQEQQKASVWPYLELDNLFIYSPDKIELSFSVVNKGVGPAKISNSKLAINEQQIDSYSKVYELVSSILKELNSELDISDVSVNFRDLSGILSPLEDYTFLKISIPGLSEFPEGINLVSKLDVKYEVCYCSIYDDCWTLKTDSDGVVENCDLE